MPLFPVTGGNGPNAPPNQQNYFSRSHSNNRLPDAVELASRLEEARTSAKLLEQVVMNTPPGETLDSDLIKEFADRCLSASRSIQGYMVSTDPAPDNDTMESLIDTNEQLQTALNQHQRAVLSARKQLGQNVSREDTPVSSPPADNAEVSGPVAGSSRNPGNGKGKQAQVYKAKASGSGSGSGSASGSGAASASGAGAAQEDPFADPFADPQPEKSNGLGSSALGDFESDRHFSEPFHPGFTAADSNVVGGSSNATGGSSTRRAADVAIDDDLYESTAGRKKEFAP